MDLAHLILDDSYVLGISIEPYVLEFRAMTFLGDWGEIEVSAGRLLASFDE